MTDMEQIQGMLERIQATPRVVMPDFTDDPSHISLEVNGGNGPNVTSLRHCFVRFTFNAEGALANLSFGY